MSQNRRVLLAATEREIGDFLAGAVFEELLELFPGLIRLETEGLTEDAYVRALEEHKPEILLSCWSTPSLPAALCPSALEYLKYNCHLCGTIRRFVAKEFLEEGLVVTNWGSSIADSVAECALLLALSCLRRSTMWAFQMHQEQGWKQGNYGDVYGLFERKVGIHGFGAIARSLLKLLQPFRVPIRVYSPSVPDAVCREYGVERAASLTELFSWADVAVELAPKKPEYYHIVDESVLRQLRPGSVFVNVGRGACVDEEALIRIAQLGEIQVGLDVYETEPLPGDSPLRGMTNVTLLPHIGGPTRDRRVDSGRLALVNLKRYLAGEPLEATVTAETYDRIT